MRIPKRIVIQSWIWGAMIPFLSAGSRLFAQAKYTRVP
jgi:hypothetical protein